ncbi:MAG: tyrosine-type recombinase/integrase [Propionicimonas sp.]
MQHPASPSNATTTAGLTGAQVALAGYLARYQGHTHRAYARHLLCWFAWCEGQGLDPLTDPIRTHVELYIRHLMTERGNSAATLRLVMAAIKGYFRFAVIDGLSERNPAHRVLHLVGKGNKPATMPLTEPLIRALELAAGDRTNGPLLLRKNDGKQLDRHNAAAMVDTICRHAGITKHISPHSLRHSMVTNALDAGVPLRDVQIAARHADPRTTVGYDRARENLDRHAIHALTADLAGAS